jgi:hypothetical protein
MLRKLLISSGVATIAIAVTSMAGVVDAGRPAAQGCYGESISALAGNQAFPGAFGAGVRGFAQQPDGKPGLGDGVQLLKAGLVPDDVVPNTCNG